MRAQPAPQVRSYDAFISHASEDSKFAAGLVRSLQGSELKIWFDDSALNYGTLLRNQIQAAIGDSGALVLIWSEAANRSRWVMAELFTAFHLGRFIIPCVRDATPLPHFLHNAAYLDSRREKRQTAAKLLRSIRALPPGANEVIVLPVNQNPVVASLVAAIGAGQYAVLAGLDRDFQKAADANTKIKSALKNVQKLAPLDREVLSLAGYQCKNDYIVKHWSSIQQWSFPKTNCCYAANATSSMPWASIQKTPMRSTDWEAFCFMSSNSMRRNSFRGVRLISSAPQVAITRRLSTTSK